MSRAKLIEKYEQMVCSEGEFDIWDTEIEPWLDELSTKQIRAMYEQDKQWYQWRYTQCQV